VQSLQQFPNPANSGLLQLFLQNSYDKHGAGGPGGGVTANLTGQVYDQTPLFGQTTPESKRP